MEDEEKQKQQQESFEARFRPSAEQLKGITKGCADALTNASEEDLGKFIEIESETEGEE